MKICCDIDGVLADVRPYVEKYLPHNWKTYFSHTHAFQAIEPLFALLYSLQEQAHDITLVTGRPESNRNLTERWLKDYYGFPLPILMRKDTDHRSTCEIKLEWFRWIRPDLIIDDEPTVVKTATDEGFVVLQVHGFRCTEKDSIPTNYLEEDK